MLVIGLNAINYSYKLAFANQWTAYVVQAIVPTCMPVNPNFP